MLNITLLCLQFQGTPLLSLGVSHQGIFSCPVPVFAESRKSKEKLKKNAYVRDNKEYYDKTLQYMYVTSEGGLQNSCGQ